ncbi:MAG: AMMECR1 domain-containing protein, partial [Spirochaetaceae bacterium]
TGNNRIATADDAPPPASSAPGSAPYQPVVLIGESGEEALAFIARRAIAAVAVQFRTPTAKVAAEIEYGDEERGIAVRFLSGEVDRGCTAFYRGVGNFITAAETAAVNAAFFDSRYSPITKDEFSLLDIEIAMFGEFRAIADPMDFIPGTDSLHITVGNKHTLMQACLPDQRGWDKPAFLQALCKKAGLEPDAWENPRAVIKKAPTFWRRFSIRELLGN